ncbi:MAG: MATE family efflux transporter [Gammaproteobacteria bacterium]|nr:MATE family efflux transporter [Gammaproteobacteria bacterium]
MKTIRTIILIALPLMAAFLAQRGMQFIDTLMMGWIGPTALAAGALGTSIFSAIVLFCMGALSAVGILISRAKGADNLGDITYHMQHGCYFALLLSIPCMLIIWFMPEFLLKLGQNSLVVTDTILLLKGMIWGFPGILLFLVFREFISVFSFTYVIMFVSLIAMPLTFLFNYILIYGKFHFPQLGIEGIGYSSAIVMWFMFLSLFIYSKINPVLKGHVVLTPFKWNREIFRDMLHIGVPSGILFLLEAGMFLSTNLIMGYFGIEALAAHQIAMQCVNIIYTFPIALSVATALQIAHATGTRNIEHVKHIAFISFSLVLFISAVGACVFILASHYLVIPFLEKGSKHFSSVYQLAVSFLKIAALFLGFDGLQSVVNGALRGLKDTFIPMILSVGCYWVLGVGTAYYLSMFTSLGPKGVWYGLSIGLGSTAVILVLRFYRKSRRLSLDLGN